MSGREAKAREVLDQLKDFQRATAEWAFERLYGTDEPTRRFLVADEVGLGKTMIARAVIARTIHHLIAAGDERVDIVYICSNQSIASQNVNKFSDLAHFVDVRRDSRLTLLPLRASNLETTGDGTRVNIIPLTPGTSFDLAGGAGSYPERVLLYVMLREVLGADLMKGSGPRRLFTAGVGEQRVERDFRPLCRHYQRSLTKRIVELFREELALHDERRHGRGEPDVRTELQELFEHYRYPKKKYDVSYHRRRNALIGRLRLVLAQVGLESLQPDLIILDEFQRFAKLLDTDHDDENWTHHLARCLFDYDAEANAEPARVLLLSATPYRMYTTSLDADDDEHHADFLRTTRFLFEGMSDPDSEVEALRDDLRRLRRCLFAGSGPDALQQARSASESVARRLRKVMARTERLASTPDRDGMLTRVDMPCRDVEAADVRSYLDTAAVATALGLGDPVELWKSAPYLVSFMEDYKLKRRLRDEDDPPPPEVVERLGRHGLALDPRDIRAYRRIDPANARLRSILADCVDPGHWQMLWIPPALPYYRAGSLYERAEARSFTKRLIFSAWHVVPRTVAALVSYEVERRVFDATGDHHDKRYGDRSEGLLDLRVVDGRPASMTTMALLYPCHTLAVSVDPRFGPGPASTAADHLAHARRVLEPLVEEVTAGAGRSGEPDRRWYAVAQARMDLRRGLRWPDGRSPQSDAADPEDLSRGFRAHVEELSRLAENPDELRAPPDDLVEVLARIALGSPAVTALRSLLRHFPRSPAAAGGIMSAAARAAWGLRSLHNAADTTALLRRHHPARDYWRVVLDHAIDGNLQAVLDEYTHVLRDWRHLIGDGDDTARRLADDIAAVASVRTVDYRADLPRVTAGRLHFDHLNLRARYAVRFGDRQRSDATSLDRRDLIGLAFNSPFWPFVLTTTSVGQEGLDFHQYSHAVVHWNLPSNPVDLEQREGRVHRYKGHAVRKNVAAKVGEAALASPEPDPWAAAFAQAAHERPADESEIVPYWVFNPDDEGARIERRVPVLPCSREIRQLERLLEALATYRATFGQPRQQELTQLLGERLTPHEIEALIEAAAVDLTPPGG